MNEKKSKINRIKVVLVELGLTQLDLSILLNKTEVQISNWCRNVTQPSMEQFREIALLAHIEVSRLLEPQLPEKTEINPPEEVIKINRLKIVLEEVSWSQVKLATSISANINTVSKWCRNLSQPSLKQCDKIARAIGINVSDLFEPIEYKKIDGPSKVELYLAKKAQDKSGKLQDDIPEA